MGSRASQLRNRQQVQDSSVGVVAQQPNGTPIADNSGDLKAIQQQGSNGALNEIQNNNNNSINNNNNNNIEIEDEVTRIKEALHAASANQHQGHGDTPQQQTANDAANQQKTSTLQRHASNIQSLAQRIRRSSSVRRFIPSFVNGKRKASAEVAPTTEPTATEENVIVEPPPPAPATEDVAKEPEQTAPADIKEPEPQPAQAQEAPAPELTPVEQSAPEQQPQIEQQPAKIEDKTSTQEVTDQVQPVAAAAPSDVETLQAPPQQPECPIETPNQQADETAQVAPDEPAKPVEVAEQPQTVVAESPATNDEQPPAAEDSSQQQAQQLEDSVKVEQPAAVQEVEAVAQVPEPVDQVTQAEAPPADDNKQTEEKPAPDAVPEQTPVDATSEQVASSTNEVEQVNQLQNEVKQQDDVAVDQTPSHSDEPESKTEQPEQQQQPTDRVVVETKEPQIQSEKQASDESEQQQQPEPVKNSDEKVDTPAAAQPDGDKPADGGSSSPPASELEKTNGISDQSPASNEINTVEQNSKLETSVVSEKQQADDVDAGATPVVGVDVPQPIQE